MRQSITDLSHLRMEDASLLFEYIRANTRMSGQGNQLIRVTRNQWASICSSQYMTHPQAVEPDRMTIFGIRVEVIPDLVEIEGRPMFAAGTIQEPRRRRYTIDEVAAQEPRVVSWIDEAARLAEQSAVMSEAQWRALRQAAEAHESSADRRAVLVGDALEYLPKTTEKENNYVPEEKKAKGKCKRLSVWKD